MSTNLIAFLVFVGVFGLVILVHEIGHFVVGRWMKVEVEEFGIGIPPKMWRVWWGKGHLIFNGQRIEIPSNFNVDFNWREMRNLPAKISVNRVDDELVLQTIEIEVEEEKSEDVKKDHVLLDQQGNAIEPATKTVTKLVRYGETPGETQMSGGFSEVYPGTEFTLNWLPFGGFNRFKGEDNIDANYTPEPGSLPAASPWARFAILVAGAVMNLILGVFVYQIIISQIGIPNREQVQIYEVSPNSPAEEAGFRINDIIYEMNGERITSDSQMRTITKDSLDTEVEIVLLRDGEEIITTAMPLSSRSAEEGAFGFMPGYAYDSAPSFIKSFGYGVQMTAYHARELLLLPGRMISGNIAPEEGRFIGFKGIFDIFKRSVTSDMESRSDVAAPAPSSGTSAPDADSPTYFTLLMIANLTITLGVFNLLPFPALDGGRIIFLLPELLFRRRVSPRVEGLIHFVGFMLLMGLMVYINVMDFVDPVSINFP
jgi:regulator of sigma E protease